MRSQCLPRCETFRIIGDDLDHFIQRSKSGQAGSLDNLPPRLKFGNVSDEPLPWNPADCRTASGRIDRHNRTCFEIFGCVGFGIRWYSSCELASLSGMPLRAAVMMPPGNVGRSDEGRAMLLDERFERHRRPAADLLDEVVRAREDPVLVVDGDLMEVLEEEVVPAFCSSLAARGPGTPAASCRHAGSA